MIQVAARAAIRRLLIAVVFLLPWGMTGLADGTVTQAGSVNFGSNGNCSNWFPHGWSWTQWISYPASSSGSTYGRLEWFDGVEWAGQMSNRVYGNGANADPSVDNYWGYNEDGTGSWRQWGAHYGSMISNSPQYSTPASIWCG